MAQGCGFPHTQVAKRTAPSDSAAFDKLRPRASRGELVAGRSLSRNDFMVLPARATRVKKYIHILRESLVTELKQYRLLELQALARLGPVHSIFL
jgi:hypothetical protein